VGRGAIGVTINRPSNAFRDELHATSAVGEATRPFQRFSDV